MSKCETCLNLLETFGDRYQIRWEEPANSRWTDPWYQLIPCRLGHIYPHGGDLLGFASRRRGGVTRRVASLPYATVMQAGDGGANILFPADRFFEVAMMVHPRRRRRLTGCSASCGHRTTATVLAGLWPGFRKSRSTTR